MSKITLEAKIVAGKWDEIDLARASFAFGADAVSSEPTVAELDAVRTDFEERVRQLRAEVSSQLDRRVAEARRRIGRQEMPGQVPGQSSTGTNTASDGLQLA